MPARLLTVATALLCLALSACLTRPDVRSEGPQLLTPQTPLGSVAVLPFAGPYGEMLASRVSYELLQRGYGIIPQEQVRRAVSAAGVGGAPLYGDDAHERIMALAERLGADTVVVGTVTAREDDGSRLTRVADEFRAAAPLKVRSAHAQFLRARDGATLAAASFQGEREYGVFTPNYRDAARGLVAAVLGD